MSWEPIRVYPATMGAGNTSTSEIDLKRYFRFVRLVLPTFASATDWYIQASESSGGTFRRVCANSNESLAQNVETHVVAATLGSGATLTSELDLGGFFNKVKLVLPSFTSATDWYIQASESSGGTFRRISSADHDSLAQNPQTHVVAATLGSGATLTSELDLGGFFKTVKLVLATHASVSDWFFQAADTAGGTFRRIASVVANTSSVQVNDFDIKSAVSNRMLDTPLGGYRYVKVEASTMNTDGVGLKLICSDHVNIRTNDFVIGSNVSNRMVDLPNGFRYLKVEASTMNTDGVGLKIVCSERTDLKTNDFKIGSSVSNRIVDIPTGFRYVKIEASTMNTDAVGLKLICGG